MDKTEIIKLYVDTFFQKEGIGSKLIQYVIDKHHVDNLWVLEKIGKQLLSITGMDFSLKVK